MEDHWLPPRVEIPETDGVIHVDSVQGSDATGDGSRAKPFASIAKAVSIVHTANTTVLLHAGTYYTSQIKLETHHSGLTIQNFQGDYVTVSGGVPLTIARSAWNKV